MRDNIKTSLKKIDCEEMEWILLAQEWSSGGLHELSNELLSFVIGNFLFS
jgi:hypothetical protein